MPVVVAHLLDLPLDGPFGRCAEEPRILEAAYRGVMIAHDGGDVAFPNQVDDLIRVRVVACQISQTQDLVGLAPIDLFENS